MNKYYIKRVALLFVFMFFLFSFVNAETLTSAIDVTSETLKGKGLIFTLFENWYLLLSLSFLYFFLSNNKKDKSIRKIRSNWEIPKLKPLEVGFMLGMDQSLDGYDGVVTAEIIYLAINGYIKIEKLIEKKSIFEDNCYRIVKKKNIDGQLADYQVEIINRLFYSNKTEVTLGEIKSQTRFLYSDLSNPSEEEINNSITLFIVYKALKVITGKLEDGDYLIKNSRKEYFSKVIIKGLIFFPLVIIPYFLSLLYPLLIISAMLGVPIFFILFFFSSSGQRFTSKGLIEKSNFETIKEIISSQKLDISLQKNTITFETLLPYSIMLKSENRLVKIFNGIDYYQEWYSIIGNNPSLLALTSDIRNFNESFKNATFKSIPQKKVGKFIDFTSI